MLFIIVLIILGIGFYLVWLSWEQDNSSHSSLQPRNSNNAIDKSFTPEVSRLDAENTQGAKADHSNSQDLAGNNYANSKAFLDEKMQELNSKGYELYQQAEKEQSAEIFFKAGDAYDRSYSSFWGDNVFGGVDYQAFLANFLGRMGRFVGEEGAKEIIKNAQESLVISCEFYLRSISINPNYYDSYLRLATALTVALQVDAAIIYWRKLLQIIDSEILKAEILKALLADSMGWDHRSTATKEVIYRLGLGGYPQTFSPQYIEQKAIALNMLQSSPYLVTHIHGLKAGNSNQFQI